MKGELYIISTPIGNLEDITVRAIRILKEVKLIIAEDTRTAKKLLSLLNIPFKEKTFISYYKGKESEKIEYLLNKIKEYEKAGLISEAGTPLISDPGFNLIKRAKENGIKIIAVPGATALISALTISGIDSDSFLFLGFLKRGEQKLKRDLRRVLGLPYTIIFYESPKRLEKTLSILKELIPLRRISVARELTKKFEETIDGTVKEVFDKIKNRTIKGEITIVVEGNKESKINPKSREELIDLIRSITTLSDKKIEKLITKKYFQ